MAQVLSDGHWHFIILESGDIELYDISTDPEELHNLAPDSSVADVVARFRLSIEPVIKGRN